MRTEKRAKRFAPAKTTRVPAAQGPDYLIESRGPVIHLARTMTRENGSQWTARIVMDDEHAIALCNALADMVESRGAA